MANYIKNSLEEGETIVLKGQLHWLTILPYLAGSCFGGILSLVSIIFYFKNDKTWLLYLALFLILASVIAYFIGNLVRTRTEFAVTNSRFIQKEGILNIKMTEIPLYKIETANFYQTFWQRIFGTGCIELVGSGGTPHQVHQIKDPQQVHRTIVATINKSTKESASQTSGSSLGSNPLTNNPFE